MDRSLFSSFYCFLLPYLLRSVILYAGARLLYAKVFDAFPLMSSPAFESLIMMKRKISLFYLHHGLHWVKAT